MYDERNFYMSTEADFEACDRPSREPDHVSDSGSSYWYVGGGVIREANHWGSARSCLWTLDGEFHGPGDGRISGFCPWGRFRPNPDYSGLEVVVYGVPAERADAVACGGVPYAVVPCVPSNMRDGRVHTEWGSVAFDHEMFMQIQL